MLYRTRFEHEITALREQENDVPAWKNATYYLPIELKDLPKRNKVGVHVPNAATRAKVLDLIVYFHGFVGRDCKESGTDFARDGIKYYWKTDLFKNLRSDLDDSGRAALLVAPTMHPLVGQTDSGPDRYGNLHKAGAFDRLIKEVWKQLVSQKGIASAAALGNVVLAAHSGGGSPMYAILGTKNDLRPKIRACWGFECLYPGEKTWLNWLNEDPLLRFRHFRQEGFLWRRAHALRDGTNNRFVDTTRLKDPKAHCNLINEFWKTAISHMPGIAGAKEAF